MTEFSFWVNYCFNTKKLHSSTLKQNIKLDWNILSVVCRHHDWQLWCKGNIFFPSFLQEHKTYLGFLVAAGMWATVLFLCFSLSPLKPSSQCFYFHLSFSPLALWGRYLLASIYAVVYLYSCASIFLARSGKSCFRSPPGGIKFSRIPPCHKRFCVLLKLNEVQVCWEAYLPRNGGWVMVV